MLRSVRNFLVKSVAPALGGIAIAVLFLGSLAPIIYFLGKWFKYWLGTP